ncbi:hypothetical protein E2C01_036669 [Portunus trituberculatus]|uniref:Uncharacterized protein n=1 Tax=Portunus trituberculatus TaxID=210409 RepID=A0A5B7FEX9_PORTR|nr:hypothetical protein [Portunus trituberculatus]
MPEALWGRRHCQTDTRLAQSEREVGQCSAVHSLNMRDNR